MAFETTPHPSCAGDRAPICTELRLAGCGFPAGMGGQGGRRGPGGPRGRSRRPRAGHPTGWLQSDPTRGDRQASRDIHKLNRLQTTAGTGAARPLRASSPPASLGKGGLSTPGLGAGRG